MISVLTRYAAESPAAAAAVLLAMVGFLVVGSWLAAVDLRTHLLPDRVVLPAYPAAAVLLGSAAALVGDHQRVLTMLGGAVVLWLAYFLLRVAYPPGMGFGDVKLAGLLGLYLGFAGWDQLLWGTVAAFGLGALWSVILLALRRGTLSSAIAFGPFMIAGAALVLALPSLG